ncbi:MAG: hypothetical protein J6P73_09530 [Bacteroidales bacterium]|nr:hypothetical protein [Bacteroidales bacterium]
MITVEKVLTRKQRKEFIDFPLNLYKGNPCFTPPLYMDERKIFKKNYVYNDICEAVHFNAYKDGVMAGRISGIIQNASNEKTGEKQVRFTRFDVIEDQEVARALFQAVEDWAVEKGMEKMVGPLGFSDLEREGLLISGFDIPATFEESYNHPYYQTFIENLGYQKEVDWTGSFLRVPKDYDGEIDKMADFVMKRYHLHLGTARNTNEFIKKYADGIFELIDKSYDLLYGTVPFTEGMKKIMIDNFRMVVNMDNVSVILDENDNMIGFGICFPAIGDAVRPSQGRLTPLALIRLLKAIKKPTVVDLGLIGVDPKWLNRGVSIIVSSCLIKILQREEVLYADTNLNLEENYAIQNQWKRFDEQKVKLYRCFGKKLEDRRQK